MQLYLIFAALFFVFIGCGKTITIIDRGGNYEPCVSSICGSEPSFCSPTSASDFANPVTISGSAFFKKRLLDNDGLAGPSDNLPIKYAEVAILNTSGTILGCGKTDVDGNFSIPIESTSAQVLAEVRSRANTIGKLRASVLDGPKTFNYYKVKSETVTATTNQNLSPVVAPHNGSLEGGAFNILDQLYNANEFLRINTTTCGNYNPSCSPVNTVPKAFVFWKPGFNPGTYLGNSENETVSFYIGGMSRLFIVGGHSGDVDRADTDHFDDVIILHEYGHLIEDHYARSDSPGGSHNANSIIDPRLAWSEGWATYFALAVRQDPYYIDTKGNSEDGDTAYSFYNNLDTNSPQIDPSSPPTYTVDDGQNVFREFAISRVLLDMTDEDSHISGPDYDDDGTAIPFAEFWAAFSSADAFAASSTRFRNASKFFQLHDNLSGRTNIKSELEDNKIYHPTNATFLQHYATPVSSGACSDTAQIKPANNNDRDEDGSFENSNQFASNDFYHLSHGGGSLSIDLQHSGGLDLDLFLYKDGYTYGDRESMIANSIRAGSASESIAISNLTSGHYMINVMVYMGDLSDASPVLWPTGTYQLRVNGSLVCP